MKVSLLIALLFPLVALAQPNFQLQQQIASAGVATDSGFAACVFTNDIFTPLTPAAAFGNTSNANWYATAAFTPISSGDLLVLFASFSPTGTETVTNTGTTQFTWWQAAATNFNTLASPTLRESCWVTQVPTNVTPFSMKVVLLSTSGTGANMHVLDLQNTDTSVSWGSNAVVQARVIASNSVANPRLAMNAPNAYGRNMWVYGVADSVNNTGDNSDSVGATAMEETAYNTPACGLATYTMGGVLGYTGITNTASARAYAVIGLEIQPKTNACPSVPAFNGTNYYVNTGSLVTPNTPGGDGTTTATSGAHRAFAGLADAIDSLPLTMTQPVIITCSGEFPDTNSVVQNRWNLLRVTTPENYIEIDQAASDWVNGVYDSSKYHLAITNESAIYNNGPSHVRINGLQVLLVITTSGVADYSGIRLSTANVGVGRTDGDCRIANCVVKMIVTGSDRAYGYQNSVWAQGDNAGILRVWNCLAYGGYTGFTSDATSSHQYYLNCTAVSNVFNFVDNMILRNCLSAYASGDGFGFLSVAGITSYNNSSDESSTTGIRYLNNQTFTFTSLAAENFHLQSGDTGAKGLGFPDPGYGIYTNDVTLTTRSAPWSIGFHQP